MVLEILSADRVCMETVWEFRGIVKAKKKTQKHRPKTPILKVTWNALLHTDLDTGKPQRAEKACLWA